MIQTNSATSSIQNQNPLRAIQFMLLPFYPKKLETHAVKYVTQACFKTPQGHV